MVGRQPSGHTNAGDTSADRLYERFQADRDTTYSEFENAPCAAGLVKVLDNLYRGPMIRFTNSANSSHTGWIVPIVIVCGPRFRSGELRLNTHGHQREPFCFLPDSF